jgi:hypothetical protein
VKLTNDKNGINNTKLVTSLIVGTGLIGVLVAGAMSVASDAAIAIKVAEQHGEELLMVRGELSSMRHEMNSRTQDRYTGKDGARFEMYVNKRLDSLEKQLDRIEEELKR